MKHTGVNVQHSQLIAYFKRYPSKNTSHESLHVPGVSQESDKRYDAAEITKFTKKSGPLGPGCLFDSHQLMSHRLAQQLALNDCIAFSHRLLILCPNDIGGQISSARDGQVVGPGWIDKLWT